MTLVLKKTQNISIWSSNQKYVGVINDAFFYYYMGQPVIFEVNLWLTWPKDDF